MGSHEPRWLNWTQPVPDMAWQHGPVSCQCVLAEAWQVSTAAWRMNMGPAQNQETDQDVTGGSRERRILSDEINHVKG